MVGRKSRTTSSGGHFAAPMDQNSPRLRIGPKHGRFNSRPNGSENFLKNQRRLRRLRKRAHELIVWIGLGPARRKSGMSLFISTVAEFFLDVRGLLCCDFHRMTLVIGF